MSGIAKSDTEKGKKLEEYAGQFKKADWEALGELMQSTQDRELLQVQQELFANTEKAGLWRRGGHPFIAFDNKPQTQQAIRQFEQVQNALLGNDWQKQMYLSNQHPEQAYDDEMEQRRRSALKPRF